LRRHKAVFITALPMPVSLERLSLTHRQARLKSVRQNLDDLAPSFYWCVQPYTDAANRQRIASAHRSWESMIEFNFAVLDAADGAFLGEASLDEIDTQAGSANLSYWIRRDARRRGCGTAAAQALAAFAFRELGLQYLLLLISPDNGASLRVASKLGACVADPSTGPGPADAAVSFILDHRHRSALLQLDRTAHLHCSLPRRIP
jgi:RimJ/RimL family protein N-acetyltransferase